MEELNVDLRLEVGHMRHSMIAALSRYHLDVQAAVNKACEEYIASGKLEREMANAFSCAAAEEIQSFFKYGKGREAIEEAVEQGLGHLAKKAKR